MANFTRNNLFRRYDAAQKAAIRQAWRSSDAHRMMQQVDEAVRTPHRQAGREAGMANLLQRFQRHGFSAGLFRGLAGQPFQDMVREVVRYQATGGEGARLVGELLGALGPLGSLLQSLLGSRKSRPSGLEGELERAIQLLQAFAPEMLTTQTRRVRTGDLADTLEVAIARVEAAGYEVRPKEQAAQRRPRGVAHDDPVTAEEKTFYPGGVPKTNKSGNMRREVDLEFPQGGRRFRVDHPIVTGEMVTDFSSSNVYGYSYDYDSETMYVRYKADERFGGGAGPLYAYSHVPPDKFESALNAPSKGSWLWDNVRIRGTVGGHQHGYRLVAVRHGYVPRKATFGPGGEFLAERQVRVRDRQTGRARWLKSKPATGVPNRGTPRRDSRG